MTFRPNTRLGPPPRLTAPDDFQATWQWLNELYDLTWKTWFPKQVTLIDALSDTSVDPFGQYLVNAPTTALRNTVVGASGVVPLTIQGDTTAPTDIQIWKAPGSGTDAKIDTDGKLFIVGVDAGGQRGVNFRKGVSSGDVATWEQIPIIYGTDAIPGGNTVANTAAETTFTSSYTVPANELDINRSLMLKVCGTYSTALAAPTIRIRIKMGTTTILDSGTITVVGSLSDSGWVVTGSITITDAGAGGHIDAQGDARFSTAATTVVQALIANHALFAIDTTTSQAITVTVQWGTASASNTITLRQLHTELFR